MSPLGASVTFFLVCGGLYVLIGVLTPLMMDSEFGRKILMMSNRTGRAVLRHRAERAARDEHGDGEAAQHIGRFHGRRARGAWLFVISVAWFGLRQHQVWSLVTLSGIGLLIVPYWYLSFRPYLAAGISFSLSDLPPIFWIPAALLLPAGLLGGIGLR